MGSGLHTIKNPLVGTFFGASSPSHPRKGAKNMKKEEPNTVPIQGVFPPDGKAHMSTENLTEDMKHNFEDLTHDEQETLLDPMVPFITKANLLEIAHGDLAFDEVACYLCKQKFSSEAHYHQHVKSHLRKMGATGEAY
jgi:hypothetical protein